MDGLHTPIPGERTGNRGLPPGLVRQHALHRVLAGGTEKLLVQAGLAPGMRAADIGCGVGLVTMEIARLVGPRGLVVGVDADLFQLGQGRELANRTGVYNVWFDEGTPEHTGLPRSSFQLVYCRGLLARVTDPGDTVAELVSILEPGGVLVCEETEITPDRAVTLPGIGHLPPSRFQQTLPPSAVVFGRGASLPALMRLHGLERIGAASSRPVSEALAASVAGGILSEDTCLWQTWGRKPPLA